MINGKSVLVNRSTESFDHIATGCVVEDAGSVRIGGELFGQDVRDSC
jgi:hypothetical protein